MDEVLAFASELGRLIARHERFSKLRAAEDAVYSDKETRCMLAAFEAQRRKVGELEAAQKPVEPADKREFKRLNDAVHANAAIQALARVQADYVEMMNRVNDAIRKEMEPPASQDDNANA